MSKLSQNKNVPELRFPEFTESLSFKYLGKILDFKNGINADKSQYGRGKKFINVLDIINNAPIYHHTIIGSVDITDKEFEKNDVQYGDILFQRSSEIREESGQSNIYLDKNQKATFGGFVIRGRPKLNFDPIYFNYLLKTDFVRKEITDRSGGSTRFNVGQDTLGSVPVLICNSSEEQEKIASFLSAVDKKLIQLQRKKELLESYKRGLMQKLFSQKIRLKQDDGTAFPDWQEKNFGDLIKNYGGSPLENLVTKNGSHKFISIGNYSTQGKYIDNGQRINLDGKAENKQLNKCDLVMVLNDKTSSGDLIGSTILIEEKDQYVYNQRSERIVCLPILLPKFAWLFVNSREFRKKIFEVSQGGTQIYVNFSEVKKLNFPVPSLLEQQKIVHCLTVLDKKIEAVSQQIYHTEQFKKGLLQKMFV